MHNDRTVTNIPDLEYAHAEEYGVRICMHTQNTARFTCKSAKIHIFGRTLEGIYVCIVKAHLHVHAFMYIHYMYVFTSGGERNVIVTSSMYK